MKLDRITKSMLTTHERAGLAVLLGCALAWGPVAQAEAPKGGPDAATLQSLRKAQGTIRQLTQEKTDLETQAQALQDKIKSLEAASAASLASAQARIKQLEPLENEVKLSKASLEELRNGNTALQQRISEDTGRLQSLAGTQKKTAGELEKFKRDNELLVNAVLERTRWIETCTGKNQALIQANRELLEKYSSKGVWDTIKSAEPFTGINAVAEENKAQEFSFKLGDLQVTPWQEPPADSAPPPAPAAQAEEEAAPAKADKP